MLLAVENALIEMGDGPAERNVEIKQLRQLVGRLLRVAVPPCLERSQQLPFPVKGHIAVHHGADPDRADPCQPDTVLCLRLLLHGRVAVAESVVDVGETVGPDPVDECIFPVMKSDGQHASVIVRQHGLDSCRTELYSEGGPSLFDCFLRSHKTPFRSSFFRPAFRPPPAEPDPLLRLRGGSSVLLRRIRSSVNPLSPKIPDRIPVYRLAPE